MNDEKDPGTGVDIYVGTGISDIFGKIAAKITGKTAKKLASKAAEKGMEKIGKKTGLLIGEKIYDSFKKKPKPQPPPKPEVGGKEIMAILQEQINFNISRAFIMIFFKNNKNIIKRDERKF